MLTATFAGLADLVGTALGPTASIAITQERIDAFAEATGDRQWIHTDPEQSARGPYGTTIAHGFLTLSLASQFIEQLLVVTDVETTINYGCNRVRFPAAVPVGSQLRATGMVMDATTGAGWAQLTLQLTMHRDAEITPVCVVESIVRYIAPPAAS